MNAALSPSGPTMSKAGSQSQTSSGRRGIFAGVFFFVWGFDTFAFADFLWRTQLYGLKYGILIMHAMLFAMISLMFCYALYGYIALREQPQDTGQPATAAGDPGLLPRTALLFPVCDEDIARVAAGVRVTHDSLKRAGCLEAFDFFLLSDSRDPARCCQEETAWFILAQTCGDFDRIHYRHRIRNTGMKSGNISDFLEQWGAAYRYMVIFDADSIVTGSALLELVRRMERDPKAGIIQTHTTIVRAETLMGRLEQFMGRLCGGLLSAGVRYRNPGDGYYYGHNAIVRVSAFMENCRLPRLPWREPLGGQIYSHDVVEAALMRRAGFEVNIADDIEGSYEESPATLPDSVRRHRRWCQGNMQNFWLLFSRDLPRPSRLHLLRGILTYMNSVLWLSYLIISTLVVVQFVHSHLSLVTAAGFAPFNHLSLKVHGAILFALLLLLLLSPVVLSLLALAANPGRRRAFGGLGRAAAGSAFTILVFAALSPLLMMWFSAIIVSLFRGRSGGWAGQNRAPNQRLSFSDAARSHGWITAIGAIWSALAYAVSPSFFRWMLPILTPLVLSIPVSMLLSSPAVGLWLRKHKILLAPEETRPPTEVSALDEVVTHFNERLNRAGKSPVAFTLVDPYAHALHLAMLARQDQAAGKNETDIAAISREILAHGIAGIARKDLQAVLASPEACDALHRDIWQSDTAALAPEWRHLLAAYSSTQFPGLLWRNGEHTSVPCDRPTTS